MKKKPATKRAAVATRTAVTRVKPDGLAPLIAEVRKLIQSARHGVSSVVNTFQVMTNFEIGRRIVEHEQKGEKRAGYGQEVLKALSAALVHEFGAGFSTTSLKLMRQFYLEYRPRIGQRVSDQSTHLLPIGQTLTDQLASTPKKQTPDAELAPVWISATVSRKSPFTLS